jgi:hypothetical protein
MGVTAEPGRSPRRTALIVAIAVVLVVAAAALGRLSAPDAEGAAAAARPSASPSPVTLVRVGGLPMADVDVELTEEYEPHDYSGTAPPVEPTQLDGFYLRIVKLAETGGSNHGLPYRCLRCIPFRISPGVETLTMYRGRFYLEHQMSGFRALGHYRLDGDRIAIFNDPNCSSTEGTYTWARRGGSLRFGLVEDPCPFENERADDFTYSPWTKVDACAFRILGWWPALLGC